ncbi:uncharacterized protein LOC115378668 [Myripristis murdjan]|uniref:uncharacterized protein LOC115378668 n=1 Tax=Myripristis murdjan TaxID=586833 RepID=UPI001176336A|nr:uncharacterized protein LOC115378668 [Myripristis murdjan]
MEEKELKEGCSTTENHNSFSITMETTEQSESAIDCEVEVAVADSPEKGKDANPDDEQLCLETDSSDCLEEKVMLDTMLTNLSTSPNEPKKPDCSDTSLCTEMPDQKEALILETGHDELNRNESINSSVSDTLSSADSVYENEAHHKRQDIQEPEPEPEDNVPNPEDDDYQNLAIDTEEDPMVHEIPFEPPVTEESILEQCIREEAMSDVSNESCHDLDADETDECLRVEIAAASSDSETDEKWRTIFSSSINKEDDDSYLDSLELSAQELFVQKVEVRDIEEQDDNNFEEVQLEVPQQEEVLEQPDDIASFPTPPQEVTYNPLAIQGLTKISEDESENKKDANHNHNIHHHYSAHPQATKKLPKDFCVIQETKSENVSTEHVDFQVARKQWLEMEEQTKNQIVSPATKQPRFHSSHSFMYTPVRNIERPHKREHDLENLNLAGEYPHTSSVLALKILAWMIPVTVAAQSSEWCADDTSSNLIILETSNLIIRSASEFSLNKVCEQPQEKMFLNNPFFKLRSRSQMSLVDEEIKMVKRREEELRQERARMYGKDRFSTGLMMPNHMDTLAFDSSGMVAAY